jgi:hypothetical protein
MVSVVDHLTPKPLLHLQPDMEPVVGIEPTTDGLQNRCSTAELNWLPTPDLFTPPPRFWQDCFRSRASCRARSPAVQLLARFGATAGIGQTASRADHRSNWLTGCGGFGSPPSSRPSSPTE